MDVMYYTSMLRCWQLVWIRIMNNHPCLRVGRHSSTSTTLSTSASLRSLRSSTNSFSSSRLSLGLRPRDCASTSAASCKSRSRSLPSSLTFFYPSILSRLRECLAWVACPSILTRYSFRVALAFACSASRLKLTLTRAFSEILTLSPRTENVKQLWEIYPCLLPQNTSLCLCINFIMTKCHDTTGHARSYPDTRGLLGLWFTN
jgi:hypothetical protein